MNATDVLHDNKDNICLTSYCMDCIHHEYFRYQEDHTYEINENRLAKNDKKILA